MASDVTMGTDVETLETQSKFSELWIHSTSLDVTNIEIKTINVVNNYIQTDFTRAVHLLYNLTFTNINTGDQK